jgi:DNA-binding IclR family transcriptional regulator
MLLAFSIERPVLTLGEIAQSVRLSKSTVRRLLLTLEDVGLVTRDVDSARYRLGIRCLELGAAAQASIDLRGIAVPIMRRLVQETGEAVYLLVPRGTEAVCLEIAEARPIVRVLSTDVGMAFPLHAGAAPRALLAAVPEAVIRDVCAGPLRRYTPHTMTDPAAIERDIAATRAAGYTLSVDDMVVGIAGIGAVIWNRHAEPVGAISVTGMKERFLGGDGDRFIDSLVAAARELSHALGCPAAELSAGWPHRLSASRV